MTKEKGVISQEREQSLSVEHSTMELVESTQMGFLDLINLFINSGNSWFSGLGCVCVYRCMRERERERPYLDHCSCVSNKLFS